jgi:hypothetical protein
MMTLRRRGAVEQPDQRAVGTSARCRQIFTGENPAQDVALAGAIDDEQHLARRGQCRKRQCHARHQGLHAGIGDADHAALFLFERARAGKQ